MDEHEATWIAEDWSGARGLVPRGPRWLLGYAKADPAEVERHTGRRPPQGSAVWRLDVAGRFLRSGAVVYPGGVPYPQDLVGRTATVSSEVWLYVEERTSRIIGTHSWPEAIRRPVAAQPEPDFEPDIVYHPDDAHEHLDYAIPSVTHPDWWPAVVVCLSRGDAIVFLAQSTVPDPLNEMLLYQEGGLSLRVSAVARPDYAAMLRAHQPPFRSVRSRRGGGSREAAGVAGSIDGIGREQGRTLGPQTWPWPAELMWWSSGIAFELKGFVALETLEEVARTIE